MSRLRPLVCAAALAAAIATPAAAVRGTAENGLSVEARDGRIEVFSRAGAGGSDYFCAAGDFARTRLGARATDRVEIVSALGPSSTRPNRYSVVFDLRAPGTGRNTGLDVVILRPGAVGASRSVAHARFLCTRPQFRGDDD